MLDDPGMEGVAVEPLRIGYRSTLEVLAFARAVLGPLADPEAPPSRGTARRWSSTVSGHRRRW
ncbi:MAG: hypothetical protein U0326_34435 [Polyangiales bacterium]